MPEEKEKKPRKTSKAVKEKTEDIKIEEKVSSEPQVDKEVKKSERKVKAQESSKEEKTEEADSKTKKLQAKKAKKKIKRHVPFGNAYVKATFNNTMISITDPNGNVLASASAGLLGYSGTKKSTPYVAGLAANSVAAKVKTLGMEQVNVFVKGIGSGRESAVRALQSAGLNVVAIKDITPLPHNGCRRKKVRRV